MLRIGHRYPDNNNDHVNSLLPLFVNSNSHIYTIYDELIVCSLFLFLSVSALLYIPRSFQSSVHSYCVLRFRFSGMVIVLP